MLRRKTSVRLLLTNLGTGRCEVAFEPEGATHELSPEDAFTVEFSGSGNGVVEVSYRSDGISVCGWSESTTSAWNKAGDPLQL